MFGTDIDFMGLFSSFYSNKYILFAIDYVSRWVEAQALQTNDSRVICRFLKKLFSHFGRPTKERPRISPLYIRCLQSSRKFTENSIQNLAKKFCQGTLQKTPLQQLYLPIYNPRISMGHVPSFKSIPIKIQGKMQPWLSIIVSCVNLNGASTESCHYSKAWF